MLIELIRFRSKMPMDYYKEIIQNYRKLSYELDFGLVEDYYYKEIIQNYRKLSYELDFGLVEDYAALFKNGTTLMNMIQMEVL